MHFNTKFFHHKKILLTVLFGLTTFALWFVCHQVPLMLDDLWYITNLQTGEPLQGFSDIVQSQIWHYFNWGGRTVAHTLLQSLLLCNKHLIEIITVSCIFILGFVISLFCEHKKPIIVLEAILFFLGFNADILYSTIWTTGSANYLYLSIFIFSFLYLYLRDNIDKKLFGISFWIIPLGLIVGWSNENMGPTIWILTSIVLFLRAKRHQHIYPWMILGNLTTLLGSILVIIAPGNFVRASSIQNSHGFFWNCFLRISAECSAIFDYIPLVIFFTILLFAIAFALHIKVSEKTGLLLLGAIISWGAMILSPHYPARSTFGTMIFLVIVDISLLHKITSKEAKFNIVFIFARIFIGLNAAFHLLSIVASMWGWYN